MALSDIKIRSAKPQDKPYSLPDSNGLRLIINPNGSRLWKVRYFFDKKEKSLSLGAYPAVSLKDARERRDEARKLLAAGLDPNGEKRRKVEEIRVASANTFKAIAEELNEKRRLDDLAPATLRKSEWFTSLLLSALGSRPITDIRPLEVLEVLKKIEKKGNHETAKRCCRFAAKIFRHAIITGRAERNPAADLGEALVVPKVEHYAAIIEPKAVGQLMRDIAAYQGRALTRIALGLSPHLFVRPGELRQAEWTELDFDKAIWCIPAAKMKMRSDHIVPLSRQALTLFKEAEAIRHNSKYVFPGQQSWKRPMCENTINQALRRMGYANDQMTAHGFRSTASTLLNESGLWKPDAIERALAHKDSNAVRGIYNRGAYWEERVKMAQWWSDYLEQLRDGADIIALKRA